MPQIKNHEVLKVIQNMIFDAHAAMHLAREGLIQPPGFSFPHMMKPGEKGSGTEFLQMHHDLIRMFRYLLQKAKVTYLTAAPSTDSYAEPRVWNLDDPYSLPEEVQDLFRNTDRPDYLQLVFSGVKQRTARQNAVSFADAVDNLGRFIETGDDNKTPGSGFHDTIHEYLGSKEGGFARGAEMNKLRPSMNNDYFWSLHLWIDGQYQRLAEAYGEKLLSDPIPPEKADMHSMGMHSMGMAKEDAMKA
jgi:hypothetical protein